MDGVGKSHQGTRPDQTSVSITATVLSDQVCLSILGRPGGPLAVFPTLPMSTGLALLGHSPPPTRVSKVYTYHVAVDLMQHN